MRSVSVATIALTSIVVAGLIAAVGIGVNLWRDGWSPFSVTVAPASLPAPQLDDDQSATFSGVAEVQLGQPCSGWLIDSASTTGPAYVITTGRCARRDSTGDGTIVDQPASGTVTFGRGDRTARLSTPITAVRYATSDTTDLAVIEVASTLGALTNNGVRAYHPDQLLPVRRVVRNVAVPVAGVPDSQVQSRIGTCLTGDRTQVAQSGGVSTEAQIVNCPGMLGGTAGSPLFDRVDRVVGMVSGSTVGVGSAAACGSDVPCRHTDDGDQLLPDTTYAVSVEGLQHCFAAGRFALAGQCPLPPP